MFGVVFLSSQFSPVDLIVFNKIFNTPLKILTSWAQIQKDIFVSDCFLQNFGFENCQVSHVLG